MKRSTLILIIEAVALGAFVYFYEIKSGKPRDEKTETSKPAFNFKREDVTAVTLTLCAWALNHGGSDEALLTTQAAHALVAGHPVYGQPWPWLRSIRLFLRPWACIRTRSS